MAIMDQHRFEGRGRRGGRGEDKDSLEEDLDPSDSDSDEGDSRARQNNHSANLRSRRSPGTTTARDKRREKRGGKPWDLPFAFDETDSRDTGSRDTDTDQGNFFKNFKLPYVNFLFRIFFSRGIMAGDGILDTDPNKDFF
jgi:hypothetical protein